MRTFILLWFGCGFLGALAMRWVCRQANIESPHAAKGFDLFPALIGASTLGPPALLAIVFGYLFVPVQLGMAIQQHADAPLSRREVVVWRVLVPACVLIFLSVTLVIQPLMDAR